MVMSMGGILGATSRGRFSIPDRSRHLFRDARRDPRGPPRRLLAIDARRHPDELEKARAERAERRAADFETDLGDAEITAAQERHGALDASRHQIRVRRLA